MNGCDAIRGCFSPVFRYHHGEFVLGERVSFAKRILPRTKAVAKDLPEKTEITMFCEMGKEQRAIYESYRNLYRSKILGTIENQGIEKSQFAILQGLMKLRQICDSPAILNEEIKYSKKKRTIGVPEFRHFTEYEGRFVNLLPIKDGAAILH